MEKKFDLGRFESYSYDRFHCIRPSLSLLASMIFLCRGFIASVIAAATTLSGKSIDPHDLLLVDTHWTVFLAAIPAMAVMCALFARVPSSIGSIRVIWKYGRFLLCVSAISQIVLVEGPDNPIWKNPGRLSDISIALLGVDALILAHILISRRVKDTFADFPAEAPEQST